MSDLRKAIRLFQEVTIAGTEQIRKMRGNELLKNISSQQLELIKIVRFEGAISPGRLADIQGVHKSAISNRLKKLVEKGWLQWVDSEGDKRTKLVQVTDKGISIHDEAEEIIDEICMELLEDIQKEDIDTFVRILTDVKEKLRKGRES